MDERWQRAVAEFLAEIHGRSGSAFSLRSYGTTLRAFFRRHSDPSVVTRYDVHAFCYGERRRGGPPKPSTIVARFTPILGLYRKALEWKIAEENPAEGMKLPKPSPGVPRGIEPADLKRLLEVIPSVLRAGHQRQVARRIARDRALIVALVITGLRIREVLRWTAGDILDGWNTESGAVHIITRTKGGRKRKVFLPPPILHSIAAMLRARGQTLRGMEPGEPVFHCCRDTFGTALERYAEAAGIKRPTPHQLRNSAAQIRYSKHKDPERIRRFLDHVSLGTTTSYLARLVPEEDEDWREVAELLGIAG